jgi:hypothetical protein
MFYYGSPSRLIQSRISVYVVFKFFIFSLLSLSRVALLCSYTAVMSRHALKTLNSIFLTRRINNWGLCSVCEAVIGFPLTFLLLLVEMWHCVEMHAGCSISESSMSLLAQNQEKQPVGVRV